MHPYVLRTFHERQPVTNNSGAPIALLCCCVVVIGVAIAIGVAMRRRMAGPDAAAPLAGTTPVVSQAAESQPGAASLASRYLRSAPPGQRKDVLSAVSINLIAGLPVAARSEFGAPVTDVYGLEPATEVVRQVLQQDRSMYAWLARTSVVCLDAAMANGREPWVQMFGMAMNSVGFEASGELRADLAAQLPSDVLERVDGLHGFVMNLFWLLTEQQQFDDGPRDRSIYQHLFESSDPRTELTAHDIAAYAGVVLGRLRNSGVLGPSTVFSAAYTQVPPMHEPGWYPNPYNFGEVVNGEAGFQRIWDGTDWTRRIRVRVDGGWVEREHDLRTMPEN